MKTVPLISKNTLFGEFLEVSLTTVSSCVIDLLSDVWCPTRYILRKSLYFLIVNSLHKHSTKDKLCE